MKPFINVRGRAAVWLVDDLTIDAITPMRRILLHGDEIDRYAFESYRYLGGDADRGELNPDFPLNREENQNVKLMIVGENFGCGSAREPAAAVIANRGIQCLIGVSFGTTFVKSCYQQCVLPIAFPHGTVLHLSELAQSGGEFEADLRVCVLRCPDGEELPFAVDESRRLSMMEGLDDVGVTLKDSALIDCFFEQDRITRPWFYGQKD